MQEFDLYLALDYKWYLENVSNLAHWELSFCTFGHKESVKTIEAFAFLK